MRAKQHHSTAQPRKIALRWAFRCALVILLISGAATAFAQPEVSPQSSRGTAGNNAPPASSRPEAAIDAGRIIFNQRCEVCHYSDSTAQKIGPGLKGLFTRAKFTDGSKVSEASVAARIGKGGKDMPAYEGVLKAGQLQALIAYLKTR